ncbi:dual specificity protein phosphatase MPK-4-like isoform X2 [Brienomyrus brachyistius]|uniref:dual specificity protein phosphatase MPK-4-like isoform X2 n=1 Tax=Brienomyrus brachyistius TaxID=42636 RepID=UPI0020B1EAAA|nr:dual specificity protein phosphatase MPK-4-like isoform X2 [Brienomyrus brachyistius]
MAGDLIMKKDEQPPVALTPQTAQPPLALTLQTPQRAQQLPYLLLSSDSSSPQRALDTWEWKSSLRVQMEGVLSTGGARSTNSLERALHLCAFGSPTGLSSDPMSPVGSPKKVKACSRLSHFLPSWNSSSESDSGHSTSSTSKKSRDHPGKTEVEPRGEDASYNHYFEPIISKVTDYIYVGNLNAAYSGLTLCRSHIDSIIDMSNVSPERVLLLIPCSCSRGGRHSWSRLKVDIGDLSMAAEGLVNQQLRFSDINECIDASAEKRKRVLVHCLDGFSLAPTCVIQYLMVKRNMTLIAAYELLKAKHPVNLKESHQNVLVSLEQALRPWNKVDPECCKQALSRKVAWRWQAH